MEIPEAKGTYVLILHVPQMKRLEIGRLGTFDIVPGFYAYLGSAFGSGGIRARVGHHLESVAQPHWHIDWLLSVAVPVEVWYAVSDRKLESEWAEMLHDAKHLRTPIPRFGSSDYHRSMTSHLFYSKRPPSFTWFQRRVREIFEPGVEAQRLVLRPGLAGG